MQFTFTCFVSKTIKVNILARISRNKFILWMLSLSNLVDTHLHRNKRFLRVRSIFERIKLCLSLINYSGSNLNSVNIRGGRASLNQDISEVMRRVGQRWSREAVLMLKSYLSAPTQSDVSLVLIKCLISQQATRPPGTPDSRRKIHDSRHYLNTVPRPVGIPQERNDTHLNDFLRRHFPTEHSSP